MAATIGPTLVETTIAGVAIPGLSAGQTTNIMPGVGVPLNFQARYNFAQGVGANQAQTIFSDKRTLAASANETLNLNGGTLTDEFGNLLVITKIKALLIYADPGNVNDVLIGAAANPIVSILGAAGTVLVKPGGCAAFYAPDVNGYAVVAATAMNLKIANSGAGTGVTYTIIVIAV